MNGRGDDAASTSSARVGTHTRSPVTRSEWENEPQRIVTNVCVTGCDRRSVPNTQRSAPCLRRNRSPWNIPYSVSMGSPVIGMGSSAGESLPSACRRYVDFHTTTAKRSSEPKSAVCNAAGNEVRLSSNILRAPLLGVRVLGDGVVGAAQERSISARERQQQRRISRCRFERQ